jgi:hypothetical protein
VDLWANVHNVQAHCWLTLPYIFTSCCVNEYRGWRSAQHRCRNEIGIYRIRVLGSNLDTTTLDMNQDLIVRVLIPVSTCLNWDSFLVRRCSCERILLDDPCVCDRIPTTRTIAQELTVCGRHGGWFRPKRLDEREFANVESPVTCDWVLLYREIEVQ